MYKLVQHFCDGSRVTIMLLLVLWPNVYNFCHNIDKNKVSSFKTSLLENKLKQLANANAAN